MIVKFKEFSTYFGMRQWPFNYLDTEEGTMVRGKPVYEAEILVSFEYPVDIQQGKHLLIPTIDPYLRYTYLQEQSFSEEKLMEYAIPTFLRIEKYLYYDVKEDGAYADYGDKVHIMFEEHHIEGAYQRFARAQQHDLARDWFAVKGIRCI